MPNKNLFHYAKKMRRNPSLAENIVWRLLRNRRLNGYKFRRQFPIPPFIVDFICLEQKIILEMDGDQHADAIKYDAARTRYLNKKGFKVLRVKNMWLLSSDWGDLENLILKSIEE